MNTKNLTGKKIIKKIIKDTMELVEKNEPYDMTRAKKTEILQAENEKLITQLHISQEAQENHIIQNIRLQQENSIQIARAKRMLNKLPCYWDVESLEVKNIKAPVKKSLSQWKIKNIFIGERFFYEITLNVLISDGAAEILIKRNNGNDSSEDWIEWGETNASAQEISSNDEVALSSLRTTDWKNLQWLVGNMINALSAQPDERYTIDIDRAKSTNSLNLLKEKLSNWPLSIRFDDATVIKNLDNQGYQGLEIVVDNFSIGHHEWKKINYRISTVDTIGNFGENPRIEFLESTKAAFENWFTEKDETLGKRLEMRFAKPNAIDTDVWNKLSNKDKILLSGIISSLQGQLFRAQRKVPHSELNWEKWLELSHSIKTTLRKNNQQSQIKTKNA